MIKCPVCCVHSFEEENDFAICPVCRWENDGVNMDDPDFPVGANYMSLNEYKAYWEKHGKSPKEKMAAQVAKVKTA